MRAQDAPDHRIALLAERQHGVVSFEQLLACGLARRGLAWRVEHGRLHRLHRGVYAVGHRALTREGRWLAAAMACGDGAMLSHATAAQVWGLRASEAKLIDVTVGRGGRKAPAGVRLHRCRRTHATKVGALPVTTVAQTLLDLAAILPQRALERALEEAEKRHYDAGALASLLAAHPNRRGAPKLRAALEMHGAGGTTLTRSELEERFLTLCDDHGIRRPSVNTQVEGYEADFAWRDVKLIVETDGFRDHRVRSAFEGDRERNARLVVGGWTVLRVTHRRLATDARGVATDVAALLRRLRRTGPARASGSAPERPGRRPR